VLGKLPQILREDTWRLETQVEVLEALELRMLTLGQQ
jgi:hypothetical protein